MRHLFSAPHDPPGTKVMKSSCFSRRRVDAVRARCPARQLCLPSPADALPAQSAVVNGPKTARKRYCLQTAVGPGVCGDQEETKKKGGLLGTSRRLMACKFRPTVSPLPRHPTAHYGPLGGSAAWGARAQGQLLLPAEDRSRKGLAGVVCSREGARTGVRRVDTAGWQANAYVVGWPAAAITLRCHRRGLSSGRDPLFPPPTDANTVAGSRGADCVFRNPPSKPSTSTCRGQIPPPSRCERVPLLSHRRARPVHHTTLPGRPPLPTTGFLGSAPGVIRGPGRPQQTRDPLGQLASPVPEIGGVDSR